MRTYSCAAYPKALSHKARRSYCSRSAKVAVNAPICRVAIVEDALRRAAEAIAD